MINIVIYKLDYISLLWRRIDNDNHGLLIANVLPHMIRVGLHKSKQI